MDVENIGGAAHKNITYNADGSIKSIIIAPIGVKKYNLDHPQKN
jgi:hypothetical protein